MTVEQSTGDVYVYDRSTLRKFDASGNPVEFSSTKTNAISVNEGKFRAAEVAVDDSASAAKGDIYVTSGESAPLLIYNSAGERIGELPSFDPQALPGEEPCGVTVCE
jgi:hypothetical protein